MAKLWDTTVKLGSIEEARKCSVGAVVVAVDFASGEVTLRAESVNPTHERSVEVERK